MDPGKKHSKINWRFYKKWSKDWYYQKQGSDHYRQVNLFRGKQLWIHLNTRVLFCAVLFSSIVVKPDENYFECHNEHKHIFPQVKMFVLTSYFFKLSNNFLCEHTIYILEFTTLNFIFNLCFDINHFQIFNVKCFLYVDT